MNKDKCQAYTKKRKPCNNYAMNGSDFCYVHKGLFKDFPPVKITSLICPYCEKSLRRGANFCKFCKNSLLMCPYCDEPLRKDAKFCSFCKNDLTPVIPKRDKLYYYGKLIEIGIGIRNRIAAKRIDISYGFFLVVFFLLITFTVTFFAISIFLHLIQ
jgi:hypothetical protein